MIALQEYHSLRRSIIEAHVRIWGCASEDSDRILFHPLRIGFTRFAVELSRLRVCLVRREEHEHSDEEGR